MVKDNDQIRESSSIIEEIEAQLQDVLEKRKKAVEQELEEKIRQAQEEANLRKTELESQLKGEQEALINYKNLLSEFESSKEGVKTEIKAHLDTAIQLQTEIEEKTALSLDELRTVSQLTQKLEGINTEASEKVHALKADLEEKFGIVAQVPDSLGQDEVDFDLETELRKLQKIKELLGAPGTVSEEDLEIKKKPGAPSDAVTEEGVPQDVPETADADTEPEVEAKPETEAEPEEEAEAEAEAKAEAEEPTLETAPEEIKPEENESTQSAQEAEEAETPSEETPPQPDKTPSESPLSPELDEYKEDASVQAAVESLSQYRQSEAIEEGGEVVSYQKDGTIVLDSENLLLAISEAIDKAEELYIKLSDTESPKEQFFIKQEIIKHQDNLRKIMLSNIRLSEKDTCSLPKLTEDVVNPDTLKSILEKVSMENWSNKDDFSAFQGFAKKMKEDFYKLITPPDKYFENILDQLK